MWWSLKDGVIQESWAVNLHHKVKQVAIFVIKLGFHKGDAMPRLRVMRRYCKAEGTDFMWREVQFTSMLRGREKKKKIMKQAV